MADYRRRHWSAQFVNRPKGKHLSADGVYPRTRITKKLKAKRRREGVYMSMTKDCCVIYSRNMKNLHHYGNMSIDKDTFKMNLPGHVIITEKWPKKRSQFNMDKYIRKKHGIIIKNYNNLPNYRSNRGIVKYRNADGRIAYDARIYDSKKSKQVRARRRSIYRGKIFGQIRNMRQIELARRMRSYMFVKRCVCETSSRI